jgi:peroxiredoxin
MGNFRFRKRLYRSVAALLSLFAVCSNNLYATNDSGSGNGVPIVANDSPQNMQESKVGLIAPKFTLTSIDGKSVSLANYPGQYVILNFWASSSQESRKVNAEIAKLEKKYSNSKIVFIGISFDENRAEWQAAVQQDGLTGTQVSELKNLENADIAKQYGVSSVPAIYVISPDGCIFDINKSGAELEQKLNALLY